MANPWDVAHPAQSDIDGGNPWDVAHPKDETVATPARSTPLSMRQKANEYLPSWGQIPNAEELKRQAGLTARMGLEGFVSPVLGAADIVGSAANTLLPKTMQIPSSQGQFSQGLTELGLPQAQAPNEKTASNIGTFASGVMAPTGFPEKASKVISPIIRKQSEELMQSALKPTLKTLKNGDAAIAINTMLDKGISLSKSGISKMHDQIDKLNDQIETAISNSVGKVSLSDIMKPVQEKLNEFKRQVNPDADVAAVKQAWDEFKANPLINGKGDVPVQLAQELKQGTYRQLSKKYGQIASASDEAQKAIARGLKEGVAKNAPEVVKFNKEESDLIKTLNVAERRVLMDANKNPMGLAPIASNPKASALFMLDRSAAFKTLIARIMNASKNVAPNVAARGVQGALASAIKPEQQQEQPRNALMSQGF